MKVERLPPDLRECATAIGNVCVVSAYLESTIDSLLGHLLEVSHGHRLNILNSWIDPRDKIQTIIGLGYMRMSDSPWFNTLKWCLDTIDNDIRNRRNRFVHDRWITHPLGVTRIQKKTGFKKRTQSFQPPAYYSEISERMNHKEIYQLVDDILRVPSSRLLSCGS
jgi:hypothetical protein